MQHADKSEARTLSCTTRSRRKHNEQLEKGTARLQNHDSILRLGAYPKCRFRLLSMGM